MLRHWLDKFDSRDTKKRLKRKGAMLVVEGVLRHNVALGTCFSEERDLLSQWRGYAQDGAGFSVTFDTEKLQRAAESYKNVSPLTLSKVYYGSRDIVETNDIVKKLYDAFSSDAEQYDEGQDGIGRMSLNLTPEKHQLQKEAARSLFTVKNGAFKEEKEWRLFFYDSISEIRNVEFRESRNILSPFVRLKLSAATIRGVTLGPTNPTSRQMVEAALETYQISAWVRSSNASYRNI